MQILPLVAFCIWLDFTKARLSDSRTIPRICIFSARRDGSAGLFVDVYRDVVTPSCDFIVVARRTDGIHFQSFFGNCAGSQSKSAGTALKDAEAELDTVAQRAS